MFSSSQNGGELFGGGGFMATQSNPDSSSLARKAGSQNNGLLPLTVKQLSQASQKSSDDSFDVDGVDVNNVTLVGMVFNKEEKSTDVSFNLDDGTGRIEIRRWIDGQDMNDSMEMQSIQNGSYVRVHGHLRSFQSKKNISAFSVRPIADFNEVTFHFLECILVHIHNTKANGTSNGNSYEGQGPGMTGGSSGVGSTANNSQYVPPPQTSVDGGTMDDCQRRVHAIFEEPASLSSEAGLHIDDVARRIVGFSKKQVKDAVEFLVNEGMIYSTIDDDHFKSTNG